MTEQQQIPTSEVLYRAGDLIEERGWESGPLGWFDDDNAGLCLEGALMAALRVDPGHLICSDDDGLLAQADFYTCPVHNAVAAYLGLSPRPSVSPIAETLWQWNDAPGRTAAEVIEVLRAAAVIEAAKENAEVREAVSA